MLTTHLFAKTVGKKEWIHAALRAVPRTLKLGNVIIATAARDSQDSNSGSALVLGAGWGWGRPTHTPLPSSLASEAEATSKDCGCPTPSGPRESFPPNSVGCPRCHQRGHFPWKSYQEIFLQCLAVLADENKMFALAICLVLKTSRDNAKALAENRMLSLLGWPQ